MVNQQSRFFVPYVRNCRAKGFKNRFHVEKNFF